MKPVSLNLIETSGPIQARNGIVLPLPLSSPSRPNPVVNSSLQQQLVM